MSILDLLDRGRLRRGERLVLLRRSATPIEALIQPDGTIEVGDRRFGTPTEAAKAALGTDRPVNGWDRWRVLREGGRTLADLRKDIG
jgi:hypothetical protein